MDRALGIKDLCKSCTFFCTGCWIVQILGGVAEGSCSDEDVEIWVVKCGDYTPVKEDKE